MGQGHFLQGHFLRYRFFSKIFFLYLCVFKMKSNNFLVGSVLIEIGFVIGLVVLFLVKKQ